ncbi:MAG: hypothetical protein FGM15_05150 [Chthoniobacterales bacterium]|nr:hypothetical protein [Chthoniobacterales bacterium]
MTKDREVRVTLSLDGKLTGGRVQADRIKDLLRGGKVRRLRVTFVPRIVGGAATPALLGVPGRSNLSRSLKLRLESASWRGGICEAVYSVPGAVEFSSAAPAEKIGKRSWTTATKRKVSSAA